MQSPDGNIEVVRKKNFSENDSIWCGWIEIPGHKFLLRGRKFSDPMVFSTDSRFLAIPEYVGPGFRVVVLDFLTDRQTIVHEPKSESVNDLEAITSLRWSDASTLRIGTGTSDLSQGERIRIWKARS